MTRQARPSALRFAAVLFLKQSWSLAVPAFFVGVAVCLGLIFEAWGTLPVALGVFVHMSAGMLGSYVVHESGHFVALGFCGGVTAVSVESRLARISLRPEGELTPREAIGVAVAGPFGCLNVGAVLMALTPEFGLGWWYLAHVVFLAPCFGDGRALLAALRRLKA